MGTHRLWLTEDEKETILSGKDWAAECKPDERREVTSLIGVDMCEQNDDNYHEMQAEDLRSEWYPEYRRAFRILLIIEGAALAALCGALVGILKVAVWAASRL